LLHTDQLRKPLMSSISGDNAQIADTPFGDNVNEKYSRKDLAPRKKKRLKEGMSVEDLLDGWTQCCYYMKVKKRLCNIGRSPGSMYCGNHGSESDAVSERVAKDAKHANVDTVKRIPCPIDPTHDIFSHNLKAHVKVCNTGKRYAVLHQQPYYCKDCNSGSNLPTIDSDTEVDVEVLVNKVRSCYGNVVKERVQEPSEDSDLTLLVSEEEIVRTLSGTATAFEKLRHAQQDVRISREMESEGLLYSRRSAPDHEASDQCTVTTYVELGAGKGLLGLAVNTSFVSVANKMQRQRASSIRGQSDVKRRSRLVMVERMGVKKKADKTLRECFQDSVEFERVRMDIRDCLLAKLPGMPGAQTTQTYQTNQTPSASTVLASGGDDAEKEDGAYHDTVLIAKHLCGLATDITLRSLASYASPNSQDEPQLSRHVRGVSIATCCHHACSWQDYVGSDWLIAQGFTSAEFELMTHWSGWAHTIKAGLRLPQKRPAESRDAAAEGEISSIVDDSSKAAEAEGENAVEANEHSVGNIENSRVPRPALSYADMSAVGKMVKRVLDEGRVQYLNRLGLRAVQRRYCDPELSPECYLILATRK
jgi:tRNA:m4X modification enzyme